MIRMEAESKLSPDEVIEKARAFFGPGGIGLEVTEFSNCCARFEGGGGQVYVQAAARQTAAGRDPSRSRVEIQGREWERQIKDFLGQI
jgi:hypothetical protein